MDILTSFDDESPGPKEARPSNVLNEAEYQPT